MKCIIEHLEPQVFAWCIMEYKHISRIVGKENCIFTNVPKEEHHKLLGFGSVHEEKAKDLGFSDVCLLDPESDDLLTPADADVFTYYLFGGILGDFPMRKRTKEALTSKLPYPTRNIGKKQMSTDTAVNVVHKIIDFGVPFDKLQFVDEVEIVLDEGYSQQLPYRYLIEDGKPVLPEGIIDMLLKED